MTLLSLSVKVKTKVVTSDGEIVEVEKLTMGSEAGAATASAGITLSGISLETEVGNVVVIRKCPSGWQKFAMFDGKGKSGWSSGGNLRNNSASS